jgi:hypothetical protein
LNDRLDRLERATFGGCVIIWQDQSETPEQAQARWKAKHPSEDLEGSNLTAILVGWEPSTITLNRAD